MSLVLLLYSEVANLINTSLIYKRNVMKIYLVLFLSVILSLNVFSMYQYQEGIPPKIQNFLDKHFGAYEIEKLKYDAEGGECKVKYKNGIEVEFGKGGNWEEIESDYIPLPKSIIDILPMSAIDFIAKKYPRKPIIKIERKSSGYKVKLERSVTLIFDNKGSVIKIED